MEEQQHISSAFDRDLEEIQVHLLKMGGLAETAILDGAKVLRRRDEGLAKSVRKRDREIDELDQLVNEQCAQLLALRQPIARDLRTVLAVMKIATHIERIGHYAKNMARRSAVLVHLQPIEGTPDTARSMIKEVSAMLSDVLKAFVERDTDLAVEVRERDVEVDHIYNAVFRQLVTYMIEDPRNISACMHYHFIAKNIENMGDHVTAIADQVVYMATGEVPEEPRLKASAEAYALPDTEDSDEAGR